MRSWRCAPAEGGDAGAHDREPDILSTMTQHPVADELPGPDPAAVHERSVAVIRAMDAGNLEAVGGLLGELDGPEEFAAQVVSLASLARLLLDQGPQTGPDNDEARSAVLDELARVLAAAETPDEAVDD